VELCTAPPAGSTVICAGELGPVIPRTFPPAPGWSPGGHRIKAPLEYSRGPEKTWVYGGLRVAGGQAVTMCASSRNSAAYQDFLQLEERADPEGTIWVITDNLSSHDSKSTRAWPEDHPRILYSYSFPSKPEEGSSALMRGFLSTSSRSTGVRRSGHRSAWRRERKSLPAP
jgi:DDE superfamily endonuclease